MQAKTWPDNTVENKIKWASMENRPSQFRTLTGTIEEVKKFFANNQNLLLPKICEEISKLVDLLLCSGYRSGDEEGEYAKEIIKKIKNERDDFPLYLIFIKMRQQYWVVTNYVRKYAPYYAEGLQKLSPTFDLAYLISYAAHAFHYRVGNCMEHAFLAQTLLLYGGKDYFHKNDIYCACVIITKKDGNHAQVLLVRGKELARIIKAYFLENPLKESGELSNLGIKSWSELVDFNSRIIKNYEEAKKNRQNEKENETAGLYYKWLKMIDNEDIENIYRRLKNVSEENAYIADGFWGEAEHPKVRIESKETCNFTAFFLFSWGCVPDLKVLFCQILYYYKDFLLSSE